MKKMFVAFAVLGLLFTGCSKPKVSVSYEISDVLLGDTDKAIGLEGDKGAKFDEDYFLTVDDLKPEYQQKFKGWFNAKTGEEITKDHVFEEDTIIVAEFYTNKELEEKERYQQKIKEKVEEKRLEEIEATKEDKSKMIVFTQLELKKQGFEDDTSPLVEDWDIDIVNKKSDPMEWRAVTKTNTLGKVKFFIYWDQDNEQYTIKFFTVGDRIVIDNR